MLISGADQLGDEDKRGPVFFYWVSSCILLMVFVECMLPSQVKTKIEGEC